MALKGKSDIRDSVSAGSEGFVSRKSIRGPRNTVAENLRKSVIRKSMDSESHEKAMAQSSQSALTDIEEFLNHFSSKHPLYEQGLTKFALLVKNEDFHLYSVMKNKKQALLKVMCDPDLFYAELSAVTRLGATGSKSTYPGSEVTLRLKEWFTF